MINVIPIPLPTPFLKQNIVINQGEALPTPSKGTETKDRVVSPIPTSNPLPEQNRLSTNPLRLQTSNEKDGQLAVDIFPGFFPFNISTSGRSQDSPAMQIEEPRGSESSKMWSELGTPSKPAAASVNQNQAADVSASNHQALLLDSQGSRWAGDNMP